MIKESNLVLNLELEVLSISALLSGIFELLMSNLKRFDRNYQLYKILFLTTDSYENNDGR